MLIRDKMILARPSARYAMTLHVTGRSAGVWWSWSKLLVFVRFVAVCCVTRSACVAHAAFGQKLKKHTEKKKKRNNEKILAKIS